MKWCEAVYDTAQRIGILSSSFPFRIQFLVDAAIERKHRINCSRECVVNRILSYVTRIHRVHMSRTKRRVNVCVGQVIVSLNAFPFDSALRCHIGDEMCDYGSIYTHFTSISC